MTHTQTRVVALLRTLYGPIETGLLDLDTRFDAALVDDLGLDSLDLLELTMAFEEEFDIEIADDEAQAFGPSHNGEGKTVADWVALVERKLAVTA